MVGSALGSEIGNLKSSSANHGLCCASVERDATGAERQLRPESLESIVPMSDSPYPATDSSDIRHVFIALLEDHYLRSLAFLAVVYSFANLPTRDIFHDFPFPPQCRLLTSIRITVTLCH